MERNGSLSKIVGVCPYISPLGLHYMAMSASIMLVEPDSNAERPQNSPELHRKLGKKLSEHKRFHVHHSRTLCEIINCQLSMRIVRQEFEGDIFLPLPDHKVHHDEGFEDYCPCRIAQSVLKGSKYLRNSGFTGVRRYKDVFDVFGLGRGKLFAFSRLVGVRIEDSGSAAEVHLDLGRALYGLFPSRRHGGR
jgi:hypothetical protein